MVLVGPAPRYVTGKCCGDRGHVDNSENDDFEEDMMEAQETYRRFLISWAVSINIQAEYLFATALMSLVDPFLTCRISTSGDLLWLPGVLVHLSESTYRDMATAVMESRMVLDENRASIITPSENSHKRKR